MAYERFKLGSIATLMSTELNSLANNTNVAASAAYDNTPSSGAGDGSPLAEIELVCTFGTAPTAGTSIALWFLQRPDGTNYEDGSSSVTPARAPDCVLPLRAVTTAQRVVIEVAIPPGPFIALARNDATGQSLASSGNTIKIRPYTLDGV
jgi:hypothetical protein